MNFELMRHQRDFVLDLDTRFTAFVGGFRSGKTYSLMAKSVIYAANNPGASGAICLPTMGMLKRAFKPEFEAFLDKHGVKWAFESSTYSYFLYFNDVRSRIFLLSSENYVRARNLELAWFALDESDAMITDRADGAWTLFISRLSGGRHQGGFAVSTPEGFGFMYRKFQEEIEKFPERAKFYKLYRGRTYDNITLPKELITSLENSYPPQLVKAYLNGEFVNLSSGPVYPNLTDANLTSRTLQSTDTDLHIGIDFNYNAMSATVAVTDTKIHIVDEIMGSRDTASLIAAIKERYTRRNITVYPDASSAASKTSAQATDIAQLKTAGFKICAHNVNPRIKDRVNSVNALLNNNVILINKAKCNQLYKSLQQQVYGKDGMPVKDGVLDGPNDALGYFIYYRWPLQGRGTLKTN